MPDDVFASFINTQYPLTKDSLIDFLPAVLDTTGNIRPLSTTVVSLQPGYYLISYKVSCIFREPNYMQITPIYNGMSHLETGIYFATSTNGSSACGSAFIILYTPNGTEFSLNYSGSSSATDGDINITMVKLRRTV